MSDQVDAKPPSRAQEVETGPTTAVQHGDHAFDLDEKAKMSDYKADAILAENAEHNMTVMEAVKAYPMATFWAFIMSFTIVSYLVISSRTGNRS